jgi:hypothetical protein
VDTPDLLLVLGQAYLLLVVSEAAVHYRPLARPLCQSRFVSVRVLELLLPLLPLPPAVKIRMKKRFAWLNRSLFSPPAGVATLSYLCDWAQVIECTLTRLAPLTCQREGCDVLIHHLCQSAWEQREGYEDVLARYCCRHHPNYKYRGTPEKSNDANVMQAVVAGARAVNVESQVRAEGVGEFLDDWFSS